MAFENTHVSGPVPDALRQCPERPHLVACQLGELNDVADGVIQHRDGCEVHIGGGIVNSAPRALIRSWSPLTSSVKNMAAGLFC